MNSLQKKAACFCYINCKAQPFVPITEKLPTTYKTFMNDLQRQFPREVGTFALVTFTVIIEITYTSTLFHSILIIIFLTGAERDAFPQENALCVQHTIHFFRKCGNEAVSTWQQRKYMQFINSSKTLNNVMYEYILSCSVTLSLQKQIKETFCGNLEKITLEHSDMIEP